MRAGVIVGLLLIGTLHATPKQTDKPHTNQEAGQQSPRVPSTPIAPTRPSPDPEQTSPNGKAKEASWCKQLFAPVLSNWPLIAVAIWGILVARSTLHAIKWQAQETANATQAMRDSLPLQKSAADAALKNAQAVINAERPWVVITPVSPLSGNVYSFQAANYGRTPAEIISSDAQFDIVVNDDDTVPPEMGSRFAHRILLLPMRDLVPLQQGTPLQTQIPPKHNVYTLNVDIILAAQSEHGRQEIRLAQKYVRASGTLVYSDVLTKDLHRTRFCYCWNPVRGVMRCGPDGANEHT